MTAAAVGLLVLIAGSVLGIGSFVQQSHRRKSERYDLLLRADMDDEAVFRTFYEREGLERDAVREIWHEIADALNLPATKMRPDDRFGRDIGRYFLFSDQLDALAVFAARRNKKLGAPVDLRSVASVDDYIRTFGRVGSTVGSGE